MPQQLNYKHLRYFFAVAREGSIVRAAERLHVSPQTISGQLTEFEAYLGSQLFDRQGKRLVLNSAGKLAFGYAEDIFALGEELQGALRAEDPQQQFVFAAGVTDVIPKTLAANILQNSFRLEGALKLICREGDFDTLLGELALNRLDFVLSDRPLAPGTAIKAYSHQLGESGVSFYAKKSRAAKLRRDFPASLDGYPFLIGGDRSSQKINLLSWFEEEQIAPDIVAEFDDSALMKYFGQSGHGVFCTPSIIEHHVTRQYAVEVIGRTDKVREALYAISPERKVKHPGVRMLLDSAKEIFAGG